MDTLQIVQDLTRGDSLKILAFIAKNNLEAVQKQASGLSDTVLLAIVGGIVGLATIIINGRIDAKAKKAEAVAAAEAAKVSEKLQEVAIKVDGRLTQLLESLQREGVLKESKAHQEGIDEGKKQEQETKAPVSQVQLPGATHLKIIEGEIKVKPTTTEPKKKP